MSTIDREVVNQVVGKHSVDGAVAGFGVHYTVDSGADLSTGTPTATLKLDEKRLRAAEAQSGADKVPSAKPQQKSPLSQPQPNRGENAYAAMFDQGDRRTSTRNAFSQSFGMRPNYKMMSQPTQAPSLKSPLARVRSFREMRRLLTLRRTFDQIRAMPRKQVAVNPESLPPAVVAELLMKAVQSGTKQNFTVAETQALKKVGFDPNGVKKAYNRWSHALFPDSYNAAPMMKPSGGGSGNA